MQKKVIYIISGITFLLLIVVYLLSVKPITYSYDNDPYQDVRSLLQTPKDNLYEGIYHLNSINVEGSKTSVVLFGGKEYVLEIDTNDIELVNQTDDLERDIIPVYVSFKYANPDISFFERVFCNTKSLFSGCSYSKKPLSLSIQPFTFQNPPSEVIALVLSNMDSLIDQNKAILEGSRYSPTLDSELGEYVYMSKKGLNGVTDEDISVMLDERIGDLYNSFSFIPLVKNEKIKEEMITSLCAKMQPEEMVGGMEILSFEDGLNRILSNTYCSTQYGTDVVFENIKGYEYEEVGNVNEKGLLIKTFGLCMMSTEGEIKEYCSEVFGFLVDNDIFWYKDTVVCDRGSLDVFCSKEFLYTTYIILSENE